MTESTGAMPSSASVGVASTSLATRRAAAIRKKRNHITRISIDSGFPATNLKHSEVPSVDALTPTAKDGVAAAKAIMIQAAGNSVTSKQSTSSKTPSTPIRRSPVPKGDDVGTTLSNSFSEALDKIAGYAADYLYSPKPSPSRAPRSASSGSKDNGLDSTSSLSFFGLPKATSSTSCRPRHPSPSPSPPPGLAASSSNSSYRHSTEDHPSMPHSSPSNQHLHYGSRSYSNSPNARSSPRSRPNLPEMADGMLQLRPRVRAPNRPPPAGGPPPSPTAKTAVSAMARMRLSRSSGSPIPPVDNMKLSNSAPSTPYREEKQGTSPAPSEMRSSEEIINDKHRKWRIKQKQLARKEAAKKRAAEKNCKISFSKNSTDEIDFIGNTTDATDDESVDAFTPSKPEKRHESASAAWTTPTSREKKNCNESMSLPPSHAHQQQRNNSKANLGPADHKFTPKKSSPIGDCIILTGSQKVTDMTSPSPIQLLQAFMSNNCATIMSDTLSDSSDSYTEYTRDDDNNSLDSSESGSSNHSRSCESCSTRGRGRERPQSDDDTVYTNSDPVAIHKKKNTLKNGPGRQKANAAAAAEADSEAREETDAASLKRDDNIISVVSSSLRKCNNNGSPNSVVPDLQPTFSKNSVVDKDSEKERSASVASSSLSNGNFAKTFIEEVTTEGIQLTWHKLQNAQTYIRPTSIHAFIKISKEESEPSLVWDVVDTNGSAADESCDGADQSIGSESRGSIGLFDVLSVQKAGIMNLHSYPFAIPGSSFSISLQNGGVILFEAKNDAEAKKYIHGLRWVVARLAFNLIIGNRDVCAELLRYRNSSTSCDGIVVTELNEPVAAKVMDDVTNHLVEKAVSWIKQR